MVRSAKTNPAQADKPDASLKTDTVKPAKTPKSSHRPGSMEAPSLVNDYGLVPSTDGVPEYTYVLDESIVVTNNDTMPKNDRPLKAYSLNDVIDHLTTVAGLTADSGTELRGLILDFISKALRDPHRKAIKAAAKAVTAKPQPSFEKPPALRTRPHRSKTEIDEALSDPERIKAAIRLLGTWQRRKDVIEVDEETLEHVRAARSLVAAHRRRQSAAKKAAPQ